MMPPVRLRRHTDGRVALKMPLDPQWWVFRATKTVLGPFKFRRPEDDVFGEGWVELLVAELPEPDGWTDSVGDKDEPARTPYWERQSEYETLTAWTDGIEINDYGLEEDLNPFRSDALKILSAVAACERHRADRETE